MARPNDKQIKTLVKKTEEFVTKELCPLLENMGVLDDPRELKASLAATLMTTGSSIGNGVIKVKKKDGKYISINTVFDDEPDEEEDDEVKNQDDIIADKTKDLFETCVRLGRDKDEKLANVAAAAISILMVGRDNFGSGWFRQAILTAVSD